ncbi:winged helix-turn-helix domain-containing protein [Pseudomonas juntendi]|uniref:winged helix-turn-helix domain-containing protein n=1 Tax=Pseudomonas juntendi TaxID=2666183 RepID=UPI003D37013F
MVLFSLRSYALVDPCLKLDGYNRTASLGGKSITLRLTPFKILEFFALNSGRVVSRQSIFSTIWGFDFDPGTKRLEVHIHYLRKNLLVFGGAVIIVTRRGSGLCLLSTTR